MKVYTTIDEEIFLTFFSLTLCKTFRKTNLVEPPTWRSRKERLRPSLVETPSWDSEGGKKGPILLCHGRRFGVFSLLLVLGLGPACFASCVQVVFVGDDPTTVRFYGPLRGGCPQQRTLDRYPQWPRGRYGVSVTEATRKQNVHAYPFVDLMQLISSFIPNCS